MKVIPSASGIATYTPLLPNHKGNSSKPRTGKTRLRDTAMHADCSGLCKAVKYEASVIFIPLNKKCDGKMIAIAPE